MTARAKRRRGPGDRTIKCRGCGRWLLEVDADGLVIANRDAPAWTSSLEKMAAKNGSVPKIPPAEITTNCSACGTEYSFRLRFAPTL